MKTVFEELTEAVQKDSDYDFLMKFIESNAEDSKKDRLLEIVDKIYWQ